MNKVLFFLQNFDVFIVFLQFVGDIIKEKAETEVVSYSNRRFFREMFGVNDKEIAGFLLCFSRSVLG